MPPPRPPFLLSLGAPLVGLEKIAVHSINAGQRSSCQFITFNASADSPLRPIGDGVAAAERHSTSAVTRYDIANARTRALFHTLPLASGAIRTFPPTRSPQNIHSTGCIKDESIFEILMVPMSPTGPMEIPRELELS